MVQVGSAQCRVKVYSFSSSVSFITHVVQVGSAQCRVKVSVQGSVRRLYILVCLRNCQTVFVEIKVSVQGSVRRLYILVCLRNGVRGNKSLGTGKCEKADR